MLLKFSTNNGGQNVHVPVHVRVHGHGHGHGQGHGTWTWTRADHVAEVLHQQWRTKDVHVHVSLSIYVPMDVDTGRFLQ
jgi:hypothetical protein